MRPIDNCRQTLKSSVLRPTESTQPGFRALLRVRLEPGEADCQLPDLEALEATTGLPAIGAFVLPAHLVPEELRPPVAPPALSLAVLARCGKWLYDPRRPFVRTSARLERDLVLFLPAILP